MTPPRFAMVESAAGAAGFVASLARRFKPSLLLWAFGLILAQRTLLQLQLLRQVEFYKSELLIDSLAIVCLMVAVIVADEAVARGVPRMRAYLCAVVLGCATAAWGQWELRVLLGWDAVATADDDGWFEVTQPPQVFFHLLLVSAVACFVYVNRCTARAAALRLRAAELGRAQSRRRTLESRLQAMQARVEPQFLFNTLAQVRELETAGKSVFNRSCAQCHGNGGDHPSGSTPLIALTRYHNIFSACPRPVDNVNPPRFSFAACSPSQMKNVRTYEITNSGVTPSGAPCGDAAPQPACVTRITTSDPGRLLLTGYPLAGGQGDIQAMDNPSLRGISRTAPYFTNNTALTLEEVLEHYKQFFKRVQTQNPAAPLLTTQPGVTPPVIDRPFTDAEVPALLAYLRKL